MAGGSGPAAYLALADRNMSGRLDMVTLYHRLLSMMLPAACITVLRRKQKQIAGCPSFWTVCRLGGAVSAR